MSVAVQRNDPTEIHIEPTGSPLGATVFGIDLAQDLSADIIRLIERAWFDHLVLRFRDQRIDDGRLMAFSARFGTLDPAPLASANPNERDQSGFVTIISNVVIDGKAIGALGAYEALWHTDMSYNDKPPIASLLYAIEVPPAGGDTGFCNMYLAYERLPADLKAYIAGLVCRHDASRNSAGELRRGYREVTDPREAPGALHPLVITHPDTGRSALYLGRRRNSYVMGLPLDESERLLDLLWQHVTASELAWYQQWRVGDVIMWDNRCAMHRRDAFDPAARRVMHRTQITGAPIA